MKKIIFLFALSFFLSNCSNSDSSKNTPANSDGTGGSLARFAMVNDYLYIVDEENLNVISIVDSQDPVQVNTVEINSRIETLFSLDNYLFIGGQFGMYIYDIANPEIPTYVSSAVHFTSCDPVVANQTTAFVSLHSESTCGNDLNELEIYNIDDILNPILIQTRSLIQPKGLGLYNDYLFVCDDALKIFNISIPENTSFSRSIDMEGIDVIILSDILYLIGNEFLSQYTLNPNDINDINLISTITL